MSDIGEVLLALTAIVAPLWLAWLLLGRSERRKAARAEPPEDRSR